MDILGFKKIGFGLVLGGVLLGACSSTPAPRKTAKAPSVTTSDAVRHNVKTTLPDRVQFMQKDRRWAAQTLGGSGETLSTDGCLVTASAMALANLGFRTDPGDLVNRLKANKGFTSQGWLVWSGLEKVTGHKAKTYFYRTADDNTVKSCLAAGYYPLVKFKLKSRRSHWAVVVSDSKKGFLVRDPMVNSKTPVTLSSRAQGIDAVRCIGVPQKA